MTLTSKKTHEKQQMKEESEDWKECWNCQMYVNKQEGKYIQGRWFCDSGCFQTYLEEKETKAKHFEDIRKELGLRKKVNASKVVEKVIEITSELSMYEEGFRENKRY